MQVERSEADAHAPVHRCAAFCRMTLERRKLSVLKEPQQRKCSKSSKLAAVRPMHAVHLLQVAGFSFRVYASGNATFANALEQGALKSAR